MAQVVAPRGYGSFADPKTRIKVSSCTQQESLPQKKI